MTSWFQMSSGLSPLDPSQIRLALTALGLVLLKPWSDLFTYFPKALNVRTLEAAIRLARPYKLIGVAVNDASGEKPLLQDPGAFVQRQCL